MGVSGQSAYKLIQSQDFVVQGVDKNPEQDCWSEEMGLERLHQFTSLIVSPGICPKHPICQKAHTLNIPMLSELELGLQAWRGKTIAITGTNGKTTATHLLTHVLNVCGLQATAAGNIGYPLAQGVLDGRQSTIAVIEISSFQIDLLQKAFVDYGCILNIAQDHLDRYENFQAYASSKGRLCQFTKHPCLIFEDVCKWAVKGKCIKRQYFDTSLFIGEEILTAVYHLARLFGINRQAFTRALTSYQKLRHRIEKVKTLKGVDFYNDSKATNAAATLFALSNLPKPVHLIAGGDAKGQTFESWEEKLDVLSVHLFGKAQEQLFHTLKQKNAVYRAPSLQDAVAQAYALAKRGQAVLFSPGCSSLDSFANYAERGNLFVKAVDLLV